MIINRAEIIFYIMYFHILAVINISVLIFSNYKIPILFMDALSITGLIFVSYLSRYIVIKYQLNPSIKYGHLFSNSPFSLLGKNNLIYAKCKLYYYRSILDKNPWIHFKSIDTFSDDVQFKTDTKTVDLSSEFKKLNDYNTINSFSVTETYENLLNYHFQYNLTKIISKEELKNIYEENNLKGTTDIKIEVSYIEAGEHNKKDVIIGLNKNYKVNTYDTQVYSNFTFEYGKFFTSISIIWFILFLIDIEFDFSLSLFSLGEYSIFFLILKVLQYNLFAYILLFLLLKKYLYR